MKKLLLGMVGLVALVRIGRRRRLPARPYKAAPVVVAPIYDWTGFYIGANGGWGQSRDCWSFSLAGMILDDGCASRSGGVLGGQIGYRWQSAQFVFGLEALGDWADIQRIPCQHHQSAVLTSARVDAIGLFTGQIGYAWNNALFYVKGGAATVRISLDVTEIATGVLAAAASSNRWGGTVGLDLNTAFAELDGRSRI